MLSQAAAHLQSVPPPPLPLRCAPCWGPDPKDGRYPAGISAHSWFTRLLRSRPPSESLVALSRVVSPSDCTPVLLSALDQFLDDCQHVTAVDNGNDTDQDNMAAWATYNVVVAKAIRTRNLPLVRACLREPRWRMCTDTITAALTLSGTKTCHAVLPLVLADPRCGPECAAALVPMAMLEYQRNGSGPVGPLLESPLLDPWVVWGPALRMSVDSLIEVPVFWRVGESVLLDPEWAWRRSLAMASPIPQRRRHNDLLPDYAGVPYPKLLSGMPEDVQFKLHLLLALSDVVNLRSSCRSLVSFPMTRFAPQRLHFECVQSATCSGYRFDPAFFKTLVSDALAGCCRSTASRNEVIGCVLVESAHHLTDVQLSLDLLSQLGEDDDATQATTTAVYLTWTLHTLLTAPASRATTPSQHTNPPTSALLHQLLVHPHLPFNAWAFVIHNYESASSIFAHDPSPPVADPTSTCHLLAHLARTRTLPSVSLSLLAPAADACAASPLLFTALAVLSDSQPAFTTLISYWSDHGTSDMAAAHRLALALALASPTCTPAFVRAMLAATRHDPYVVSHELVRLFRTGRAAAAADADEACFDAKLDLVLASIASPDMLRALMYKVRPVAPARVQARILDWWVARVGEDVWAEGWADMRTAVQGVVVGGDMQDVWVAELRNTWEAVSAGDAAGSKRVGVQTNVCSVQ